MNDWKTKLRSDVEALNRKENAARENMCEASEERFRRVKSFMNEIVAPALQEFKRVLDQTQKHSVEIRVTDFQAELRIDGGQLLVYITRLQGDAVWVESLHFGEKTPVHKLGAVAVLDKIPPSAVLDNLASAYRNAREGAIKELSVLD